MAAALAPLWSASFFGHTMQTDGLAPETPNPRREDSGVQNVPMQDASPHPAQPRNQLHGVTLEAIVLALQARYGWGDLAVRIPVRCFSHDPSIKSSLKFLRKTPWAREKVEGLYLYMLREERRRQRLPD
jgi:hypothetical protein